MDDRAKQVEFLCSELFGLTRHGVSSFCDLASSEGVRQLDAGRIVFEGTPTDLVAARSTLTGWHLAACVGT